MESAADYLGVQLDLFEICGVSVEDDIRDISYGKTCPEHSAATGEMILEPCSRKSARPKFQCLKVESGRRPEWSSGEAVRLHGESSMLNIGESPNEENESFLSRILEADVPEKYYLSTKACEGIIRRAERRGKDLPKDLKEALEWQASLECAKVARGGAKVL